MTLGLTGLSLQEAWEALFDSVDTLNACVRIATGVVSTIKINPARMRSGLSADMLATDLAEYLVRKGKLALVPCCSERQHFPYACPGPKQPQNSSVKLQGNPRMSNIPYPGP